MLVLEPKLAILDETDSGLDIDALQGRRRRASTRCARPSAPACWSPTTSACSSTSCPTSCTCWCAGASRAAATRALALELERRGYDWVDAARRPDGRSMSAALTSRIAEDYAASAPGRAAAVAAARRAARASRRSAPRACRRTRDENWKYANLRPLERLRFLPAAPAAVTAAQLPRARQRLCPPGVRRRAFAAALSAPRCRRPASFSQPWQLRCRRARALRPSERAHRPALRAAERGLRDRRRAHPGGAARQPAQRLELVFVASAEAASGASYPRLERAARGRRQSAS